MFLYDCSICCKVFYQIGDCVPLALKNRCRKRHAGCRLRVDPGRMIDKIRIKPGLLDLLGREIAGELIDNRRNHFLMGQFIRPKKLYKKKPAVSSGLFPLKRQ